MKNWESMTWEEREADALRQMQEAVDEWKRTGSAEARIKVLRMLGICVTA